MIANAAAKSFSENDSINLSRLSKTISVSEKNPFFSCHNLLKMSYVAGEFFTPVLVLPLKIDTFFSSFLSKTDDFRQIGR